MNQRVEVSVVVPTRDRSGLLAPTLRSVLAQREVDLEVVVVDDGSSDGTAEAVTAAGDRRLRLVRQEISRGVAAARNRGIATAAGQWVAFCDDDDLWAPDKLVRQLHAARRAGRSWVYAGVVLVDGAARVIAGGPPLPPERVVAALGRYNSVPAGGSNVMVRADVLARVGPFDTALRRTEDWDMWLRLAREGLPACEASPLVAYRQHAGNAVTDPAAMLTEPQILARRHGIAVDRAAMLRRAAWTCLRAGRRGAALHHYARAVVAGDVASVGRAAVALVHPAVGSDSLHALLGTAPGGERWAADARAWLQEQAKEMTVDTWWPW